MQKEKKKGRANPNQTYNLDNYAKGPRNKGGDSRPDVH